MSDQIHAVPGRCCACGYGGSEETFCDIRQDGFHCDHWRKGPKVPEASADEPESLAPDDDGLAAVAGEELGITIEEFIRRCRVLLTVELEKPAPDSALLTVLCNAVRLAREYVQAMKGGANEQLKKIEGEK